MENPTDKSKKSQQDEIVQNIEPQIENKGKEEEKNDKEESYHIIMRDKLVNRKEKVIRKLKKKH